MVAVSNIVVKRIVNRYLESVVNNSKFGQLSLPKLDKNSFWILSDIWLIFVNLSCPGCDEMNNLQEINVNT